MQTKANLKLLMTYIEKEKYRGYDPYDALNSSILKAMSINKKFLRIVFIQVLKRFPLNLRTVLGIDKDYNSKGLGLFLWGYSKLFLIEKKEEYLRNIDLLLTLLGKLRSNGYSGNCWGYNFDWQSRAFFVPKFTPTIVNSAFIGHALLDTYRHTGNRDALATAISIKDFILNNLNRKAEDGT